MRTIRCALAYGSNSEGRCEWDGRLLPPRRRRWCAIDCQRAYATNHYWSAARARAVLLADGRCDICGDDEDLQVHHVVPVAPIGGAHHQENLQVLCPTHHVAEHAVLRAHPGDVIQPRLVA